MNFSVLITFTENSWLVVLKVSMHLFPVYACFLMAYLFIFFAVRTCNTSVDILIIYILTLSKRSGKQHISLQRALLK